MLQREERLQFFKRTLEKNRKKVESANIHDNEIIVFGAGNTASLYQKSFVYDSIAPLCYIDNDKSKWGTIFNGRPIYSPQYLDMVDQCVIVCSANIDVNKAIEYQLDDLQIKHIRIDEYFFAKHLEELLECANMLNDMESLSIYIEIITKRLNNCPVDQAFFSEKQYFALPLFRESNADETFADMGAYDGDTIEEYVSVKHGVFHQIYSFEPDIDNFAGLKKTVAELYDKWQFTEPSKIVPVLGGVGSVTEVKYFSCDMGKSKVGGKFNEGKSGQKMVVYALDDYFKDIKVSFFKADIESYELDMLYGAENVIKRDSPKIAICIYHNATDLFNIMKWLNGLQIGYKFAIRHHGRDLFCETVLYAYI